jgi:hypothetical protein
MAANPFDQFDAPAETKTGTPEEFARVYGPAAQRAAKALNVDPQVLLGQWGLETGWGKSIVPGTNNLGNIKDFAGGGVAATDNMTGSRDKYRAYETPDAFADDFAGLVQRKYPGAVGAKTPDDFGRALKAGGYAEDPRYAEKVTQATRMAGTRQNPVLRAVGQAVGAVVPSANAAEANPFDQFDAPAGNSTAVPGARGAAPANKSPADYQPGAFVKAAGNAVLGAVRGAGSIGATLLAPVDALARAAGVQNDFIGRTDRREAMDGGLRELGANPDSFAFKAGRVGGEVAGSAGAGGVVAKAVGAAAPFLGAAAPAAGRLATSLESGGLTIGQASGVPQNMLLRMVNNVGTRVAGGAGAGAASAGLVDSNAMGTGALVGGAVAPVARAAGAIGGAAVGAVRGMRDVATSAGQGRVAESVLRASATNPAEAAKALAGARAIVPGSNPTAAQVANDPGLAQLERTLLSDPRTAPGLQMRFGEQRAARGAAIDEVAATAPGSGTYYDDIAEGRDMFAREDYAKAFKEGIDPEMATSMKREIASLLERPSVQAAVADAKRLAAETGQTVTDIGSLRGLDWVKKAIDNQISKASSPGSALGKADLNALQNTSRDLNALLEQISPAYNEANRSYAQMSRQINSMDVARSLEKKYTPASQSFSGTNSKEQGAAYMKALREAQDSVKGATGRKMDLSQSMSTPDIFALENVAKDLARKEYAETAGRAVGSPTAQNVVSQHVIRQMMKSAGLPEEMAASNVLLNSILRPVNFAGKLAEPKIQNRLLELSLSPQEAAAALSRLPPRQANALFNLLSLQAPLRMAPPLSAD